MHFKIRPQTFLVARDKENFFFSSFGRRLLVRTNQGDLLEEVWSDLTKQLSAPQENHILTLLSEHGLIESDDESIAWSETFVTHPWLPLIRSYYSSTQMQLTALKKITSFTVQIVNSAGLAPSPSWRDCGFTISDDAPFVLFIAYHWEHLKTKNFAQKMLQQKKEWLIVMIDPQGGRIGPLLGPRFKMCWNCIMQRYQDHLKNPQHFTPYETYDGLGPVQSAVNAHQFATMEHLIQKTLIKFIMGVHDGSNQLLHIDLTTPTITPHTVWPNSNCECFYVW